MDDVPDVEPELPLDVRRVVVPLLLLGAEEVRELAGAGASAAGAATCACSNAEIESRLAGLGETERALSTGVVSVFEHAIIPEATKSIEVATISFLIVLPLG